jgi:8-oxo-dGTP diphosphatase
MPASAGPTPVMHVMAGVLLDERGRVLLAQRPVGKHLAGMWEFPGGKIEAGESPEAALARELGEEIGVVLLHATPLIQVPFQALLLDAWMVDRWDGEPRSLEDQALQWLLPAQIDPATLTPADAPILQVLLHQNSDRCL